jgi:hypothetical protein
MVSSSHIEVKLWDIVLVEAYIEPFDSEVKDQVRRVVQLSNF